MNTVTVVGCGAIGLQAAIHLKANGFEVNAIEEHSSIGEPENCSGLISKSGVESLGLDLSDCHVNKIHGAKIFAPNTSHLEIRRPDAVAFVTNRSKFDKTFQKQAENLGIPIQFNTRLIDVRNQSLFVKKENHGEIMKSQIVIGSDGVNSVSRKLSGIQIPKEHFVQSVQATVNGSFDPEMVELHLGSIAPGFFAWIIPQNSSTAEIGLGCTAGINPNICFNNFLHKLNYEGEVLNKKNFLIPAGPPIEKPFKENILLLGDAAFQTKATTGGGLILGLKAARACTQTIIDNIREKKPLSDYEKNLKTVNRELKMHWKLRSYSNSLNDEQINNLLIKAKKAGVEEFLEEHGDMDHPSKFIGKVLTSPRLWAFAPQAMAIMGQ